MGVPMTDELEASEDSPKAKGGRARAASLSARERSDIAKNAAVARWYSDIPRATHEGTLEIAGFQLQCAVLADGRRVLSESGVLRALGISPSGTAIKAARIADHPERLPMFVAPANIRSFIDSELVNLLTQPIMYRPRDKGRIGRGMEAVLIPKVCEVWLNARDGGALRPTQLRIAARAEMLIRGLARTGIIALVDEATGYQEVRDRQALQAILDAFLRKEFAAWAKRFPDEYFHEIFRLRGWTWDELRKQAGKGQGPRVIGKYTNDIVYSRLAPGVLEELQRLNPPTEGRKRRAKHHQFFTQDVGHPALTAHISNVLVLLKASETWDQFTQLLNRALPKKTNLRDLPLFNQDNGNTVQR
jgi:hypothetical protein